MRPTSRGGGRWGRSREVGVPRKHFGKNSVPDRWLDYSNISYLIKGTRIVALKVPLREHISEQIPPPDRFGPCHLLEAVPNLGMILDITNTSRYYDPQYFLDTGIKHRKVNCPGHEVPPGNVVREFFKALDEFFNDPEMRNSVVAVHCTHGVNRTGYLVCKYLIHRLNLLPEDAIRRFESARGHRIERGNYIEHLYNAPSVPGPPPPPHFVPIFGIGAREFWEDEVAEEPPPPGVDGDRIQDEVNGVGLPASSSKPEEDNYWRDEDSARDPAGPGFQVGGFAYQERQQPNYQPHYNTRNDYYHNNHNQHYDGYYHERDRDWGGSGSGSGFGRGRSSRGRGVGGGGGWRGVSRGGRIEKFPRKRGGGFRGRWNPRGGGY